MMDLSVSQPFDNLYTFNDNRCFCNGNGDETACALTGFCACNQGWSGRADFSYGGYSCHIYEPAIIALWVIVILSVLATYAVGGPKVYDLIKRFLATKRRLQAKGKSYGLRNNRSLIVLIILFFITLPSMLGTALVRLVDSNQRIALSWLMSTGWFLTLSSYYLATHKYNTALATSALKAEQASGSMVAKYRWIGRGFCFVLTLSLALSVPVFRDGGVTKTLSRGCVIGYYVWVATVMFLFSFFLRKVRNHIIQILSVAEENASLLQRMKAVYDTCIVAALLQAFIFMLLAVIPILWTAHDYVVPLTFLIIPFVSWRFVVSVYIPQTEAERAKLAVSHMSARTRENESQSQAL